VMNKTTERSQVLIVGFDGATWDLIKPWAQEGKLPFLARLMDEGACLDLNSTVPPISPPAWSSFMTGKNPGKHGIFDFTRRDWESYRMRILRRPSEPAFWSILSQRGYRVGVINVPQTYPPESVNGFMVTGLGTPSDKTFTYPPELTTPIFRRGFRPTPGLCYRPGKEDELLEQILSATDTVTEITLDLMSREPWDVFVVVLRITDEASHFLWKHMDATHPAHSPEDDAHQAALLTCYQKADDALRRIVEAAGEDVTLFVMSDHGSGPLYKNVFLNEWLRLEGLLTLKEEKTASSLLLQLLLRSGLTRTDVGRALSRMGLGKFKAWLRDRLGDHIDIIPNVARPRLQEAVDWSRTRAYSVGYIGQIYVNLKGRDPQGIVEPGEDYERTRDHIIEQLLQLEDPQTRERVVDRVIKREQVYEGRYLEQAPDLFVYMKDLSYITRGSYAFSPTGSIFVPPVTYESGGHRQLGILLAWGRHILPGYTMSEAHLAEITDLAPTVLYLMSCAVPQDMDGQVITSLIEPDYVSSHSVVYTSPEKMMQEGEIDHYLTDEEEQSLIDRLKELGYL
jgi:predicted AlkP superfamily phosphohydrolase/phosphomutase